MLSQRMFDFANAHSPHEPGSQHLERPWRQPLLGLPASGSARVVVRASRRRQSERDVPLEFTNICEPRNDVD
jgi:hypothetical protein